MAAKQEKQQVLNSAFLTLCSTKCYVTENKICKTVIRGFESHRRLFVIYCLALSYKQK